MSERDLLELARDLPYTAPAPHQVEEMRTSVLAMMGTAHKPRSVRRWIAPALLSAAAVVIGVLSAWPEGSASARAHAHVISLGSASFTVSAAAPDEIIRLTDGVISLGVSPLSAGERCRVVTGDAEVEVRGTGFLVEARADRIVRVLVQHGQVELRTQGQTVFLGAGEHWEAKVITTRRSITASEPVSIIASLPEPSAASPPLQRRHRAHAPAELPAPASRGDASLRQEEPRTAIPAPGDPSGRAFREGWAALQSGDASAAAGAFEQALRLAPKGSVAEDASFWRAVAYTRAGRHQAARRAFAAFLAAYPSSVRSGEAQVMLGWALVETGDLVEAEAELTRGAKDAVPTVRASAEAGLAEIHRRRATANPAAIPR
jgi:TolA-binding protein